ncbi:MAG: hypothetical protein CMG46_07480 [Candidatus Marinimicrobia bacterium]|nr:hypothetical protein [Candidatus Neomarinimicrobiota bacterium]
MIERRSTLALLAAATGTSILPSIKGQAAETDSSKPAIAIIGTGKVGSTLGKRWADLGYKIIYGSRTPDTNRVKTLTKATGYRASAEINEAAAKKAELLLLAIPWNAAEDVINGMGDLTGKILMDPINGLKVRDGRFEAPPDLETSSGEIIQEWAKGAHVVKAFNTLSRDIMADPTAGGGPITVPLAGESPTAKKRVGSITVDMGLVPMDMGAIYLSRYLEGMARLRIAFRAKKKPAAIEFYLQTR